MLKIEDPIYKKFLKEYYWNEILQLANEYPDTRSLYIRYPKIDLFDSNLAEEVLARPLQCIEELTTALKEIDLPIDKSFDDVYVRIIGIPSKVGIGDLRSKHLSKFISIDGMIRKATEVRPRITKAAFQCMRCDHITYVDQINGYKFEEPFLGCEEETCGKKGPFKILIEESTFVDSQKLQIQEPPEDLRGTQAQSIDVDVDDDLAGILLPGERVVVNGILRSRQRTLKDGKSVYYDLYLEANSIEKIDTAFDEVEISSSDEEQIKTLSKDPSIYTKMVNSIAPVIRGMDDVKEAMVLQQFGGVPKFLPDGSYIRGDSHILFCGDPSLGKSKLMKSSQARSPRAVFASGPASSAGGLTAVVVKDDFGEGRWTVEGGALVLADKGIAFIDEADKMKPTDRDALHDAMEQQEINLSKAGIMATLKTRTSVFMAANPKNGKFDKYDPLAEQIDLKPSLLSRFDLIFVMLDTPDERIDSDVSMYMLNTHLAGELKQQRQSGIVTVDSVLAEEAERHITPDISIDLFKKYVAYAKMHIFPVLSEEAINHIHSFYMSLRKAGANSKTESVPITKRQEEAMIRLAEASARVRLSNHITLEDATRATSLMLTCLKNVGLDPKTGEIDSSIINSGTSLSQRNNIKTIKEIMKSLSTRYPDGKTPISEIVAQAGKQGIDKEKVESNLKKFAQRGDLLKPSADHVKLV
ncbi:MAG: minichromosome maintenance protein MCM [Candidatus Omnitrophica bacterium]|nr:minichromosome maintenance protein MCM [Candidatus Omnitrophota bacterium]